MQGSILIVGAGPSGLAVGCALMRQGVKARIVDGAKGPAENSRALAIQARTLEVFDQWGIVDEFTSKGLKMTGVQLYGEDKRPLFHLRTQKLPSRFPYMLVLPQSDTERILSEHAKHLGLEIERETRVSAIQSEGDGYVVTLDKANREQEQARFDWIIGCDGAHSDVRKSSGIDFRGKDYPQTFVLADIKVEWALSGDDAHIFTSREGIFACFPMPGGHVRLIASKAAGTANEPPSLVEIQELIDSRGPAGAQVQEVMWSANFFVHARLVDSLQDGRKFLVGDAAHIHSPALGQGMNTGIQDAANLGWKLALVVKGLAEPALLETYHEERWPVEKNVLKQTDFVTNTMQGSNRIKTWIRDHIGPHIMANEHVAGVVRRLVSELSVNYEGSSAVVHSHPAGPLRPGDRAPDAALGNGVRIYELLRTNGHHLLLLTDRRLELPISAFPADELTIHTIRKGSEDSTDSLVDKNGEAEAEYGWDRAYLIRPDGYIGAISDADIVEVALGEYSSRIHFTAKSASPKASVL